MVQSWLLSLALGISVFSGRIALAQPVPADIQSAVVQNSLQLNQDLAALVSAFYSSRGYQPAWVFDRKPQARAVELVASVNAVTEFGLRPQYYPMAALFQDVSKRKVDPTTALILELNLTRLFVEIARDVHAGRINPTLVAPDIKFQRKSASLLTAFANRLEEKGILNAWRSLEPQHAPYKALKRSLKDLRQVAARSGLWPVSPVSVDLRLKTKHPVVREIKVYLTDLGYSFTQIDDVYDTELRDAVRGIQVALRQTATGVIRSQDQLLWKYFAPDAFERIRSIEANLERLRWLPQTLGDRYVFVNLGSQKMVVTDSAISPSAPVLESRVIVGKPDRKTPSMEDSFRNLTLNPTWTIPRKIFALDKLEEIQKIQVEKGADGVRQYFDSHSFVVLPPKWDEIERKKQPLTYTDPASIDWTVFNADNINVAFRNQVRQTSGLNNSLGLYRFGLTNGDAIYLHDTNARDLFQSNNRLRSSGCIRVEKPAEFANYLLRYIPPQPDPLWAPPAIVAPVLDPAAANLGAANGAILNPPTPVVGPVQVQAPLITLTPEVLQNYVAKADSPVVNPSLLLRLDRNQPIPLFTLYVSIEKAASGELLFYPDDYQHDELVSAGLSGKPFRRFSEDASYYW